MARHDAGYASAVVVTVTPSQPSYFAGELFECHITFTNTNAPPRGGGAAGGAADQALQPLGLVGARAAPPPRRYGALSARRAPQLPSTHPHARQASVVAYQVEDVTQAFGLAQQQAGIAPASPATAALAPPAEAVTAEADTASSTGAAPAADASVSGDAAPAAYAMDEELHASVSAWAGGERADGRPSPLYPERARARPGYEKLYWAFAQVGGTMQLDHHLVRAAEFDQLRLRLARGELVRAERGPDDDDADDDATPVPSPTPSTPTTPRVLGGGELSYDAEYEAGALELETGESPRAAAAAGAPALAALAAMLFRPAATARAPHTPTHLRTKSTLSDLQTRALLSPTLPLYSTAPTMLGVDMELAPGESRTFSLSLPLPAELPPSFHGHAVHFDYYLTLGTNRASDGGAPHSRLLHIPLRVYNHVSPPDVLPPCMDLLHPLVVMPSAVAVAERAAPTAPTAPAAPTAREDRAAVAAWVAALYRGHAGAPRSEVPGPLTCMSVVQDLAQRAGKVSYDIAKDGHVAAVLTLARARYRLGDAVHVLLRMNEAGAAVRVVRVAASLESHEAVDAALALLPSGRQQAATRQVYATHHEATLDTRQTSWTLTIPSGATPTFATSGVQHHWSVRLALLTAWADAAAPPDGAPPAPEAPPAHLVRAPSAYSAYETSWHGAPALFGPQHDAATPTRLDMVECSVPLTVLPSRSKRRTTPVRLYA